MKDISTAVKFLKGVGPARAKVFKQLGVSTIEDLFYLFPRRYEDRKNFLPISQVNENANFTIKGKILSSKAHQSWKRRNFSLTSAVVEDDSGKIEAVWFNQRFLADILKPGVEVILYGFVTSYKGKLQFNSPEFEVVSADEEEASLSVGRIVPIYPSSRLLSQRQLRRLVKLSLDEFIPSVKDFIPFDLRNQLKLPNLAKALVNIHFPQDSQSLSEAYKRLAFDECFLYQIPILLRKARQKSRKALSLACDGVLAREVRENLKFKLTSSQVSVLEEINRDLAKPVSMQRLLEGDVGCGKTIVAFLASLSAIEKGLQVCLMVPTEIIANQHFRVLSRISKCIEKNIKIAVLTSSLTPLEKNKIYKKVKSGEINFIIGTHALLSENLQFKSLGLVIIDEQHKFGVEQRAKISKKTLQATPGIWPHVLIMTATPIPRTLAMTIYGDLDVSIIKDLPIGRQPVETLNFSREQANAAYEFLKKIVLEGKQAYIIYPIIEESLVLDLKAAKAMFTQLKAKTFKDFNLALIHSRVDSREQEKIMQGFCNGDIDILVATSILEVGVDVANASCILIEEADRFGLSTLHQLRGRVGRSSEKSYCLVVSSPKTEDATKRIKAITALSDGFKIAEADLRIRGPGEFFGSQQHGLSDLKIVDPIRQMHILKNARNEALRLLNKDPELKEHQHENLRDTLKRKYPGFETLMLTA